jgi:exodeoxyribonuclease X
VVPTNPATLGKPIKKAKMKFTVLDTETASLQGGVCDIAIAVLDENLNVIQEYESLIDPERPISPEASGIHHITDDMVYTAPTLDEFMEMNDYPLADEDLVVSGHNVQFDCRMIGDHIPKSHRRVCTLRLAKNLWPDAENHKLQTLRYKFKLDAGTAHRAMGDVITCINLLRLISQEQKVSIHGLIDMARAPLSLDTRIGFGKHKGTKLRELPPSWVQWLLEKAESVDPDLREALTTRGY